MGKRSKRVLKLCPVLKCSHLGITTVEERKMSETAKITLADLPLRAELVGKQPYGAPQLDVVVRLNTNENPYSPSEALVAELVEQIRAYAPDLNRYPERDYVQLREELARYVSQVTKVAVTKDHVWAANGSNEILQQLLQAFGGPGRCVVGFSPSYSMHPILSAGTQTEFIEVPRTDSFDIDIDQALAVIAEQDPSIVFITSPNNPTGGITPLADIATLVEATNGIVIVDEAYAEFTDAPSAVTLLSKYPTKLVVSRTMSKAFDFAGGRLGYFVADPAFVAAVMLVRLPYHLSTLTQVAATVALKHSADTLATVAAIVSERERVRKELLRLGFDVVDSHANFLFFGTFDDQHVVWQEFLDEKVLIRDVGVAGYLRVTIGLVEENDAFLAAAHKVAARL